MSSTPNSIDSLARLADVIEQRKGGDPDKSYVARLFHKGSDAILKKIGEEATEVVMACKDGEPAKITGYAGRQVGVHLFHESSPCSSTRPVRRPALGCGPFVPVGRELFRGSPSDLCAVE